MEQLKNCPNCGGVLDDEGRCMYCNAKVYDLTGLNINLDTRDVVLLKLKANGYDMVMKAFPVNATMDMGYDTQDITTPSGLVIAKFRSDAYMKLNMEFNAVPFEMDDGKKIMCKIQT